jgi:hypothetical protein
MFKSIYSFIIITFTLSLTMCNISYAAIDYKLSSGANGLSQNGDSSDIFTVSADNSANFLQSTFNLAVGISISISVVLLILAGVNGILKQFGVEQQKIGKNYNSDWWNPIVGLIIIFCSVVIVRTLNPDLLEFSIFNNLDLRPASQSGGTSGATAQ